jgi:hypothetical protein
MTNLNGRKKRIGKMNSNWIEWLMQVMCEGRSKIDLLSIRRIDRYRLSRILLI